MRVLPLSTGGPLFAGRPGSRSDWQPHQQAGGKAGADASVTSALRREGGRSRFRLPEIMLRTQMWHLLPGPHLLQGWSLLGPLVVSMAWMVTHGWGEPGVHDATLSGTESARPVWD